MGCRTVEYRDPRQPQLWSPGSQPLGQLLEPWISSERLEVRVNPEPAGGEIVGYPEQRLQLIERVLRLADQKVDPDELMLEVGPEIRILGDGEQRYGALPFSDGLVPAAEVGQAETVQLVPLRVSRLGAQLGLDRHAC